MGVGCKFKLLTLCGAGSNLTRCFRRYINSLRPTLDLYYHHLHIYVRNNIHSRDRRANQPLHHLYNPRAHVKNKIRIHMLNRLVLLPVFPGRGLLHAQRVPHVSATTTPPRHAHPMLPFGPQAAPQPPQKPLRLATISVPRAFTYVVHTTPPVAAVSDGTARQQGAVNFPLRRWLTLMALLSLRLQRPEAVVRVHGIRVPRTWVGIAVQRDMHVANSVLLRHLDSLARKARLLRRLRPRMRRL
jgi:hypothetical protein